MIRIVAFLLVVGAAMGLGVTANAGDEEPKPATREIPLPAPLALAKHAQEACGGVLARRGGDRLWRCVLSDEFDGSRLDLTRWSPVLTADTDFSSGIPPEYACYVYDPRVVSVAGGSLHLSLVKVDDTVQCGGAAAQPTEYLGGAVSTRDRLAQTYGRYEIRARFATDDDAGLQSSLILTPEDPSYGLSSGEIDIAEYYTAWPERVIPYVRYDNSGDDTATTDTCAVEDPDRFHRYALEWTPERIDVFVDGRKCLSTAWSKGTKLKHPAPFDQPFVLTMFLGWGASSAAPDHDDLPDIPTRIQVDYVHIWGARSD
jgi:beta-glucanase (GH16 family)